MKKIHFPVLIAAAGLCILAGCYNSPNYYVNPSYSLGNFFIDEYYARRETLVGYQDYAGLVARVTPANGANWIDYSRAICWDWDMKTTGYHEVTVTMSVMMERPNANRAVISAYRPPRSRRAATEINRNGPANIGWTVQNGEDMYEQFGGTARVVPEGKWIDLTFTGVVDIPEGGPGQVYIDGNSDHQGLINASLYIRNFKASIKQTDRDHYALAFNAGPSYATHTVLDRLEELNVKATFFLVGMNIDGRNPKLDRYLTPEELEEVIQDRKDVIKRILEEGHEIGNLSYSHNYLGGGRLNGTDGIDTHMRPADIPILLGYSVFRYPLSEDVIYTEIEDTQIAIQKAVYGDDDYRSHPWISQYFRLPFGADPRSAVNARTAAANLGLPVISVRSISGDMGKNAGEIAEAAAAESKPWGIISFDETEDDTTWLEVLDIIVPKLKSQGYEFITLGKMAEKRGKPLRAGSVYDNFSPDLD
ncbi:MAG: polysaccharide deacetylase family protein [Treponema sp.]|nr:polysaccharide deacetylase family protein [Treponema sp.]